MDSVEQFQTILQQGKTTTDRALKLFDELNPANVEFVMGKWQGSGFPTNHQMDGILETVGWYGKEVVNPDCVHPLLFSDGNTIFKVDPNPTLMNLALKISLPQQDALRPLYSATSKLLKTEQSKARVRMMEYRGKISATMIYDYLPINDILRKVDDNTLLGLMDFKGMAQPFFFILNRA